MDLQPVSCDFQSGLMSMQTRRSRNKLALRRSSVMVPMLPFIILSAAYLAESEERPPVKFGQLQWLNEYKH